MEASIVMTIGIWNSSDFCLFPPILFLGNGDNEITITPRPAVRNRKTELRSASTGGDLRDRDAGPLALYIEHAG